MPCVLRSRPPIDLVDALTMRFPVVRRLMCEASFRTLARDYLANEMPDPPYALLGETFPHFIRSRGQMASIAYLADIAELELARARAARAPGPSALDAAAFALLSPARLLELRPILHPSVHLVASRFPIVTVWEANQPGGDNAVYRWAPECALVARPLLNVEMWRLPPGGFAFLDALYEGRTVAAAMAAGAGSDPGFDPPAGLTVLMGANIIVGVRRGPLAAAGLEARA